MQNYDVFISYRRIDGVYPALLLFRDLVDSGYDVFFDFDSIRSGEFPQAIEEGIKGCIDFIMLVTKEAFSERIFDEN
ncbi:MAG: toll/interleukin-1 receptor domain-containing protein, partial [Acholeplasmataceae bacterium]|nr:toll/interleukin-1 receptor domain-containing protein [Acholeplasmataceae bacterium]